LGSGSASFIDLPKILKPSEMSWRFAEGRPLNRSEAAGSGSSLPRAQTAAGNFGGKSSSGSGGGRGGGCGGGGCGCGGGRGGDNGGGRGGSNNGGGRGRDNGSSRDGDNSSNTADALFQQSMELPPAETMGGPGARQWPGEGTSVRPQTTGSMTRDPQPHAYLAHAAPYTADTSLASIRSNFPTRVHSDAPTLQFMEAFCRKKGMPFDPTVLERRRQHERHERNLQRQRDDEQQQLRDMQQDSLMRSSTLKQSIQDASMLQWEETLLRQVGVMEAREVNSVLEQNRLKVLKEKRKHDCQVAAARQQLFLEMQHALVHQKMEDSKAAQQRIAARRAKERCRVHNKRVEYEAEVARTTAMRTTDSEEDRARIEEERQAFESARAYKAYKGQHQQMVAAESDVAARGHIQSQRSEKKLREAEQEEAFQLDVAELEKMKAVQRERERLERAEWERREAEKALAARKEILQLKLISAFSKVKTNDPRLTLLALDGFRLGDDECTSLTHIISDCNDQLQALSLQDNEIEVVGARELGLLVLHSPENLSRLDLQGCRLTVEGIICLLGALQTRSEKKVVNAANAEAFAAANPDVAAEAEREAAEQMLAAPKSGPQTDGISTLPVWEASLAGAGLQTLATKLCEQMEEQRELMLRLEEDERARIEEEFGTFDDSDEEGKKGGDGDGDGDEEGEEDEEGEGELDDEEEEEEEEDEEAAAEAAREAEKQQSGQAAALEEADDLIDFDPLAPLLHQYRVEPPPEPEYAQKRIYARADGILQLRLRGPNSTMMMAKVVRQPSGEKLDAEYVTCYHTTAKHDQSKLERERLLKSRKRRGKKEGGKKEGKKEGRADKAGKAAAAERLSELDAAAAEQEAGLEAGTAALDEAGDPKRAKGTQQVSLGEHKILVRFPTVGIYAVQLWARRLPKPGDDFKESFLYLYEYMVEVRVAFDVRGRAEGSAYPRDWRPQSNAEIDGVRAQVPAHPLIL
jgi:hypothetical protein